MDASAIKKKTTSVQEPMTRFNERLQEKFSEEPTCDDFEDLLPHFSHMHKISSCLNNEQIQKTSQILQVIDKLKENTNKCHGVSHMSVNLSKNLTYIVESSNTVVQLLNHVSRSGSIPLSREHHENILQIINNCLQIATERANQCVSPSAVNWPIISSLLKRTINIYKQTAEYLDSGIQDHCLLQVSTTKMLEQTSKLCCH